MGPQQSQEATSTLSALTSVINSAIVNVENSSNLTCRAGSYVTISTGDSSPPCGFHADGSTFNFSNRAVADCSLNSTNLAKIDQEFRANITNTITSFIQQQAASNAGWLATAISTNIQGANTAEQISNKIANYFKDNVKNICSEEVNAYATGTVLLCGTWDQSTVNFNQEGSVTALASCVNRTIIKAFTDDKVLNELYQKTEEKAKASVSGIDTFFIYIVIAIVIICVISTVAYYIFGGSGSSYSNGGNGDYGGGGGGGDDGGGDDGGGD